MMIRPGVPPAIPVAVPRRSLLWLSLSMPRRRSVHVHACVLLYYAALTCNNTEQRIARDCVRRVVVLVEFVIL